ncbi:NAD(P)-dependent oxidoreductase [Maridesulfovibrio sp.]|uniref:NAD-dependent epimerase/dehydratase family protein n=1 Tax=Maridesulfovibrio sp. TaxID=2795000 RepID=UPI0029C9CBD9|nr:NAD(P)-dependent oxidoreductase [Maridesulfovibrio sp.]
MKRKKILILGGMGEVGRILSNGLCDTYDVIVSDIASTGADDHGRYIQIDITDFSQLIEKVTPDIDVIINLAGLPEKDSIISETEVKEMSDLYVVGSYNVFLCAKMLGIPKVVFASTNHVSGYYENNGDSSLGRLITSSDSPAPDSAYGAMKSCAEQFGFVFANECNISIISLRIGTVRSNELELLKDNGRAHKTILSAVDTVNLFISAMETKTKYGVYYGVSDNPGKPWDIENAILELSYKPTQNSKSIVKQKTLQGK